MILTHLEIDGFRSLSKATLEPHRSLNLIEGPNGAGKSSVLEAIQCLSTGHSFRTRQSRELIARGRESLTVTAKLLDATSEREHRIGLSRQRNGTLEMRLDYEPVESVARATRLLPIKALTPDSHALVQEGPEERRRFLDWGVFHVEHRFLDTWRVFRRSLSQRNQALRDRRSDAEVSSWNEPLSNAGTRIHDFRQVYVERLSTALERRLTSLSVPLDVELGYRAGWTDDADLHETLDRNLELHRRMKTTTDGPHRAELVMATGGVPVKHVLSRGEQKVLVYLLHLAQLDLIGELDETDTVLLCDDLLSELDAGNTRSIVSQLLSAASQVFVSGVSLQSLTRHEHAMFHVEQGELSLARS